MGEEEKQPSSWRDDRSVVVLAWLLAIVTGGVVLGLAYKLGALLFVMIDRVDPGDAEAIRGIGWVFGALVGGVVAAGFGVWRAVIAGRATRAAEAQVTRQQDRDYADLFTKAVEQLGATREVREWDEDAGREVYRLEPNIEVRLGAIYALERISQDSERDHIAVMETLCAYVRENAPVDKCKDISSDELYNLRQSLPKILVTTDIQTVLRVLGRRSRERINYELQHLRNGRVFRLDLSNTNLRGADLRHSNFQHARFSASRIEGSNLYGAKFDNAHFWQAFLDNADLRKASFISADLIQVNARAIKIEATNFDKTNLSLANFSINDDLSIKYFQNAFGCRGTILPNNDNSLRPIHWHTRELKLWYKRQEAYQFWLDARASKTKPLWVADTDWTGWHYSRVTQGYPESGPGQR